MCVKFDWLKFLYCDEDVFEVIYGFIKLECLDYLARLVKVTVLRSSLSVMYWLLLYKIMVFNDFFKRFYFFCVIFYCIEINFVNNENLFDVMYIC